MWEICSLETPSFLVFTVMWEILCIEIKGRDLLSAPFSQTLRAHTSSAWDLQKQGYLAKSAMKQWPEITVPERYCFTRSRCLFSERVGWVGWWQLLYLFQRVFLYPGIHWCQKPTCKVTYSGTDLTVSGLLLVISGAAGRCPCYPLRPSLSFSRKGTHPLHPWYKHLVPTEAVGLPHFLCKLILRHFETQIPFYLLDHVLPAHSLRRSSPGSRVLCTYFSHNVYHTVLAPRACLPVCPLRESRNTFLERAE